MSNLEDVFNYIIFTVYTFIISTLAGLGSYSIILGFGIDYSIIEILIIVGFISSVTATIVSKAFNYEAYVINNEETVESILSDIRDLWREESDYLNE